MSFAKARMTIAVFAMLAFSLYSAVSLLGRQWALYNNVTKSQGDSITQYQNRFLRVRSSLPPHGEVGFFSIIPDGTEYAAAVSLTQYALAPLVVKETLEPRFVVGDFHGVLPKPADIDERNLVLLADYGYGVMLFGKTGK